MGKAFPWGTPRCCTTLMHVQTTHLQPCAPLRWMLGSPTSPGRDFGSVDVKVDMPCGERLGQPHGKDSTWTTAFSPCVLCVCAMACGRAVPHSTSPVRTGTMAISSGLRDAVPEVPFLPRQQDVPVGSSGAAGDTDGWGMQGDRGRRMAGGHRTACP